MHDTDSDLQNHTSVDTLDEHTNVECERLDRQHEGREHWRLWGPYLAERAWGTVREDYSPDGSAWEYFDHDQARSRAYRWNEDGMGSICDVQQRLCSSPSRCGTAAILSCKNEPSALLVTRATTARMSKYYFYLDATPAIVISYLYKYPRSAYPYAWLVEENRRRSRQDAPFTLLDTGVFDDHRYWDVEVRYAKASPEDIHICIMASNRGSRNGDPASPADALVPQHLVGQGDDHSGKPRLSEIAAPKGACWAVKAEHPTLGTYFLYGRHQADTLYTENESNAERLWEAPAHRPTSRTPSIATSSTASRRP